MHWKLYSLLLTLLCIYFNTGWGFLPRSGRSFFPRHQLFMVDSAVSAPGKPLVCNIDKASNVAKMIVTVSGDATSKAFNKACDLYNKEVKERDYSVPGFRPGAKLPPVYLYQMFGEQNVKQMCGSLLSAEIQDECEITGLVFVGRGRITDFRASSFAAGEPHSLEIECDLWPEITYGRATGKDNERGYRGLCVTVPKSLVDNEKMETVKSNIRERYQVNTAAAPGYAAVMGDLVKANMRGFELEKSGERGKPLPEIASGDNVVIPLEKGKFMDGLIEGLVGSRAGDEKTLPVTFPHRPTGPGAALSGKQTIFDVTVLEVLTKHLPEWDGELAYRIRDGMTLKELDEEVRIAVENSATDNQDSARDDALAESLLDIVSLSNLSESLLEDNTQQRFQQMLMDFKEQGSTDEQIAEMMTPEKYGKYKEISRPNVEKIVKLGMIFRDIAEKEKITVTPEEIDEQLNLLKLQAKQKGQQLPYEDVEQKDEIENVLLRRKVFQYLAEHGTIEYVEPSPETTQQDGQQGVPDV
jgi:trigger factor